MVEVTGGEPEVVVIVVSVNPGGSVPERRLQVSGGMPPLALMEAL